VAEKVTDGSGDKIILTPCTVAFDANGKVSSVSTAGASPLYLLPGTYDFYAITPAFASADHKSVSVAHGDDFASSSTASVELKFGGAVEQPKPGATDGSKLTGSDGAVTLAVLDRKCARLNFTVSRKSEGVEKAKFRSLWLSKLATSPKSSVSIDQDITADTDNSAENMPSTPQSGGGHFDFSVPTGVQSPTTGPDGTTTIPASDGSGGTLPAYLCAVADEVLPKTADTLHLHMEVLFNDNADKTDAEIAADPQSVSVLDAQLPQIAFEKDKQYNYRLILKGGIIFLELSVSDWADPVASWSADDLGSTPSVEGIVVGTWTPQESDSGGMGQGSTGGELGTTDWTWSANQNWGIEFGNYMQAVSQVNNWTSNNTGDNTSMGNGSASGSANGNGTWTTVNDAATGNLGASGSGTASPDGTWTPGGGSADNLGQGNSGSANGSGNWSGSHSGDNSGVGDGSASGSAGTGGDWSGSHTDGNSGMGNGSSSGSANGNGTWTNGGGGSTGNLGDEGSGSANGNGNWSGSHSGDNSTGSSGLGHGDDCDN